MTGRPSEFTSQVCFFTDLVRGLPLFFWLFFHPRFSVFPGQTGRGEKKNLLAVPRGEAKLPEGRWKLGGGRRSARLSLALTPPKTFIALITHPQSSATKNSLPSSTTIPPLIVPRVDLEALQSFCILVLHHRVVIFSVNWHGILTCCVVGLSFRFVPLPALGFQHALTAALFFFSFTQYPPPYVRFAS